MSVALSVNLNKIALLRNSREGNYPDVLEFGKLCLELGVAGLTVHPRPDQRHIRPADVMALSKLLQSYPDREFNVEGNPFAGVKGTYPGFIELVEQCKPHQCTLVPDSDSQLTSDHGFDLVHQGDVLKPLIERLRQHNIRVSLFMDPDLNQIALAKKIGADRIELYTGPYAALFKHNAADDSLFKSYYAAAKYATEIGLGVNAGHDLNLENLSQFCKVPGLLEVSIGHALTVDALKMGFQSAINAYQTICLTCDA